MKEHLQKGIILCFCLWHCTAVALYLFATRSENDRGNLTIKTGSISSPYMLSLSQWQGWDFFAPFPIQQSSRYRIEHLVDGAWQPLQSLDAKYIPSLRQSKEFAILHALEDISFRPLIPPYLQHACRSHHLKSGTKVRLSAMYLLLPKSLLALRHIEDTKLQRLDGVLGSTTCI